MLAALEKCNLRFLYFLGFKYSLLQFSLVGEGRGVVLFLFFLFFLKELPCFTEALSSWNFLIPKLGVRFFAETLRMEIF